MTLSDDLFKQLDLSEKKDTLITILTDEYGVGPVKAPAIAVLWAFDRFRQKVGEKEADKQLSELNRLREKYGVIPVYKPHNY